MKLSESKPDVSVSVKETRLEPPSSSLLAGFVEVQVGDIVLRVAIRRFRNGELRVFLPIFADGDSFLDGVEVPSDLRTEIVREALTAYEEAEARQKARQRHPGAMTANTVAAILSELESQGFDGSVEIELRAGRTLAVTTHPALARNRQNHRARGVSGADFEPLDPQTTPSPSEEKSPPKVKKEA